MGYKEKYEEALERMRYVIIPPATKEGLQALKEDIFPELAESEDERTRKMLLDQMWRWKEMAEENHVQKDIEDSCSAIAWLEKQKEQKPAEWSEEDETYLADALWCVEQAEKSCKDEDDKGACWSARRWLKALKNRGNFPKSNTNSPSEWSEEEKEYVRTIKSLVADAIRLADSNEVKDEVHGEIIAQSGPNIAFYQRLIDWVEGRHVDQTIAWKKYEDGHHFDSDTVVIGLDGSEPRLVRCAVTACYGIAVKDLMKLPKE